MSGDADWDNAEAYVAKHKPCELKWLALYRTGRFEHHHCTIAYNELTNSFSAPKLVSHAYVLSPTPRIADDFSKQTRDLLVQQVKAQNPILGVNKKQARQQAMRTPGRDVAYDGEQGYWRSVLLKLERFRLFQSSGVDPLEDRRTHAGSVPECINIEALDAASEDDSEADSGAAGGRLFCLPAAPPRTRCGTPPVAEAEARGSGGRSACVRDTPTAIQQLARTAGRCDPLIAHLKRKHKYAHVGKAQWDEIRRWTRTEEGSAWLREAGLDPNGTHLDHLIGKNGPEAGLDSVFNCYFMPGSVNSSFGQWDTAEKRAYVGPQAWKLATAFQAWVRAKFLKGVDQSQFRCDEVM